MPSHGIDTVCLENPFTEPVQKVLQGFWTITVIVLLQSQGRCEIMLTLTKVVAGIGSAGSNCYKDIYKAAKPCMTDRAMTVRSAVAKVRI